MSLTYRSLSPRPEKRSLRGPSLACALRGLAALLLGGSALAQSLVNGGVVRGTIAAPGERHTYTFDAQRYDRFELRVVDVDGSSFSPQLELYSPGGALLETSVSPDVAVLDTREVDIGGQVRPGTYTVVVSGAGGARHEPGTYDLYFVQAPEAIAAEELLDGLTIFGEIERGELDTYTFTALAGQMITGTITDLPGGSLRMRTERFGPNRGYSEGIGGNLHTFTTTVSPGGIAVLVVSDGSSTATGTGRYSILLHGVAAAPPYPPSVFHRSETQADPFLFDNAGHAGLGPRIGDPAEPFNVSLDCSGAGTPGVYALSLSTGQQSALTTPWGWLYLDGTLLLQKTGAHAQSIETWFPAPAGFSLPNDLTLVGRSYTVQGACGGFSGSFRLSGAITQTIGQ